MLEGPRYYNTEWVGPPDVNPLAEAKRALVTWHQEGELALETVKAATATAKGLAHLVDCAITAVQVCARDERWGTHVRARERTHSPTPTHSQQLSRNLPNSIGSLGLEAACTEESTAVPSDQNLESVNTKARPRFPGQASLTFEFKEKQAPPIRRIYFKRTISTTKAIEKHQGDAQHL